MIKDANTEKDTFTVGGQRRFSLIKMSSSSDCITKGVALIQGFYIMQSNLNSSNTDGSFTMANSNSFLSPYVILPLAQENKYLGKFCFFIMKLYVVCTH